ncbi:hypothetical protein B2G71_20825 [Novosphingobium sp. PC22D]|uniref:hypothetical protein n=1 Tax=Novosphingobium sp. PC22D TaxID=1962403 RepID=UPI000BFAD115|nr:hypothetical protein [Novosphingobium sp. PC22D]PEQ10752.1 hypothetical protein B2G71_20825 [Novosphingobium sp. PC22D]
MPNNSFASIAGAVPKPLRRLARTRIIPPALRFWRRISGATPSAVEAQRFRVPGHETFMGYYDIAPVSADSAALLAHVAEAARRPARADDMAKVGFFTLDDGRFVELARTTLWCWQLGARLCWWPGNDWTLAFNALHKGRPCFVAAREGATSETLCDGPVFDLARDGRTGIALNFGRLAKARPGYGFPAIADPFADELLPSRDGVTLVDLVSGRQDLLYPLSDFAALAGEDRPGAFHYLNAAALSPAGTRFSVLHKRMHSANDPSRWDVQAVVGETDGSKLRRVALPGSASHYWWLDEARIAYTTASRAGHCYWLYDVATEAVTALLESAPLIDGHPSRSPVGSTWLTDTYPDLYGEQTLYLFGEEPGARQRIGALAADPRYVDEWRCDLHPRWSPDGRAVYVDSTHEGFRAIYRIDAGPRL